MIVRAAISAAAAEAADGFSVVAARRLLMPPLEHLPCGADCSQSLVSVCLTDKEFAFHQRAAVVVGAWLVLLSIPCCASDASHGQQIGIGYCVGECSSCLLQPCGDVTLACWTCALSGVCTVTVAPPKALALV